MAKRPEQPALKEKKEKVALTFEAAYAQMRKDYGANTVMIAKDMNKVRKIPTGIPSLDFQLGGGVPMSRIIQIFGEKHCCKTYLSMLITAALQKTYGDKMVFWLDLERSFEPVRAEQVGIDLNRLIVCRPASAEPGFDELIDMLPYISGGVVDSVAAATSVAESEGTMGDKQVGMLAALMSKFFHKWISASSPEFMKDQEVPMLLLTNQVRDDIGAYIKKTKRPGGKCMEHYPSLFIDLSKGAPVKLKATDAEGEEITVGHDVKFKIPKNNVFQPDKTGSFMLCTRPTDVGGYQLNAHQVDWPKDLLKYAAHYEVIVKSGAWYSYKGENFAQGKVAAQAYLFNDGDMAAEVYKLTLAAVRLQHGLKEEEIKNVIKAKRDKAKVEKPREEGGKKHWGKKQAG